MENKYIKMEKRESVYYNLAKVFDIELAKPCDPAPYWKMISDAESKEDPAKAYEVYKKVKGKLGNHIRYLNPISSYKKDLVQKLDASSQN